MATNPRDKSRSQSSPGDGPRRGVAQLLVVLSAALLRRFLSSGGRDDASLEESKRLRFEPRDVSARGFLYFLLTTGIFLVIVSFVIVGLFSHYQATDVPQAVVAGAFSEFRPLPPPPRIQATPRIDILRYRETEDRLLYSSGWIDQKNGIARIPIDRAMELLLSQGLPTRAQSPAPISPAGNSAAPARSVNSTEGLEHAPVR